MKKLKLPLLMVFGLVLLFSLTGCHWVVLDPKGLIAAEEVRLILIATLLMLIIVVPVIIMVVWFTWRYRASNKKATYDPSFTHSNTIEAFCWIIPCIIVGILAVITWVSSHELDPYKPIESDVKPITIQAIALDWKWLFIYPDQNIATINYIEIPEDTPINFQISSSGPMNALLMPQLAGQIYAMAGMRTKLHVISSHEGLYDGFSASYSGRGFSDMKFKVKVTEDDDFDEWVDEVRKSHTRLDMAKYQALVQPTKAEPVQYFAPVEPNLFNNVLMSYMMPSETTLEHDGK